MSEQLPTEPKKRYKNESVIAFRFMSRRIAGSVLYLPKKAFDQENENRGLRVHGEATETQVTMHVAEMLDGERDGATELTDIIIDRNPSKQRQLIGLKVDRLISDDVAEQLGVQPAHQTFELEHIENDLSMLSVMRSIGRASRFVIGATSFVHLRDAPDPTPVERSLNQANFPHSDY